MSSNLPTIQLQDIERMAAYVAESKMFPGVDTKPKAAALMLLAHAEDLHPMKALKRYHMMEFKNTVVPTLKAEVMLANFQDAGGTVEWKLLTDECVTGIFTHPKGGSVSITWDDSTVKKAGLGNLHFKYPRAMKRSRCISEGIRTVYPACLHGMSTPEEMADVIEAEVVQPAKKAPKKVEIVESAPVVVEAPALDRSAQKAYEEEVRNVLGGIPSHVRAELVASLAQKYSVKSLKEITDEKVQYSVLADLNDAYESFNAAEVAA